MELKQALKLIRAREATMTTSGLLVGDDDKTGVRVSVETGEQPSTDFSFTAGTLARALDVMDNPRIDWGESAIIIEDDNARVQIQRIEKLFESEREPGETSYRYQAAELADALSRATPAAAKEERSYSINGVLVSPSNGAAVATDGHRLCVATVLAADDADKGDILIPRDTVGIIVAALKSVGGQCELGKSAIKIGDELLIEFRSPLGSFPAWKNVVPKKQKTEIAIERDALITAIKAASVCVSDETRRMTVSTNQGRMVLSADSTSRGRSIATITGVEKEIDETSLTGQYLLDAVVACGDCDHITIGFTAPDKPITIRGNGTNTVIMPIRPVDKKTEE